VRRTAAAFGVAVLAASTFTLSSDGAGAWTRGPVRIAGAHRYDTASSLSVAAFPDGADAAVIASGTSFPDGLAAGPLAASLDAPILLTEQATLPQATANELVRLEVDRVVIVGGDAAVSPEVSAAIELVTGVEPDRVAGVTRYETAAEAAAEAVDGPAVAYLASGELFADALTGGAIAAVEGAPLLLTAASGLPDVTRETLRSFAPEEIVVLGGTGSVSADVVSALTADGHTVRRLAGPDRYATAAEIARDRLPEPDHVLLAAGLSFPDALAAAPLARALDAPILLVDRRCAPYPTVERARDAQFPDITAVGGTAVLTDAAQRLEPCSHAVDDGELAPGITLQTYRLPGPIIARVVKLERGRGWDVRVATASGRLNGLRALSDVARRWDALAAINGDFYHESGEIGTPVHVMASAGRLFRAPGILQSAVGFGADADPVFVGTPEVDMLLELGDRVIDVTRYNSGVPEGDQVAMYTAEGPREVDLGIGTCRAELARVGGVALDEERRWTQQYAVGDVECSSGPFEVGAADVIVARADAAARGLIEDLETGAASTFRWSLHPDHPGTGDVVGADAPLVFAARPAPNVQPGGARAPRTAIGVTGDGTTVFLVSVDGRRPGWSAGMTVAELAQFLVDLGAQDGANLDGGGSTSMVVGGVLATRPSDPGGERGIGTAVLVVPRGRTTPPED
jgi:putative cell wall-binding protein